MRNGPDIQPERPTQAVDVETIDPYRAASTLIDPDRPASCLINPSGPATHAQSGPDIEPRRRAQASSFATLDPCRPLSTLWTPADPPCPCDWLDIKLDRPAQASDIDPYPPLSTLIDPHRPFSTQADPQPTCRVALTLRPTDPPRHEARSNRPLETFSDLQRPCSRPYRPKRTRRPLAEWP